MQTDPPDPAILPTAILRVKLPRCPCGSVKLRASHTKTDALGRRRYSRCQDCGRRLIVWIE